MYSVSVEAAALWRKLLSAVIAKAGLAMTVIDHEAPAPLQALWGRNDQCAVFMCGLPFARAQPQPILIAAPVPSPPEFRGRAQYWSDFVVRADSAFQRLEDTFGQRIAFTVPESQSGYAAALSHLMSVHGDTMATSEEVPLFGEIIAPTITPFGALTAVIQGTAEIAPIDSYALRLLQKYRPEMTRQVRVVGHTAPTSIPPLVASPLAAPAKDIAALRAAFLDAHYDAAIKVLMDSLLLQQFVQPDPSDYAGLRERFETATQYWQAHRVAVVTHLGFVSPHGGLH